MRKSYIKILLLSVLALGDCGDDDYLFEGNAHLYPLMRELQFPCANFRVREGDHQQEYWRTALPEVLTFVSMGFCSSPD